MPLPFRWITSAALLAAFALAALYLVPAWGGLPGPAVAAQAPVDQREVTEIAKVLKCPVCQNLSVADSPSPLAVQMRGIIEERLAAGQSRDEIIAYFVDRYGEEVLLDPLKRGFSQIIWWGAAGGFAAGLAAVGLFLYNRQRRPVAPAEEIALSDAELAAYTPLLDRELSAGIEAGDPEAESTGPDPLPGAPGRHQPELGRSP